MSFIKTPSQKAEAAIAQADAVLIGAGAGLSTAAGIHYDGPDFENARFDPDKVFEVQGDYGLMQCATACHPKRYSNESLVKQIIRINKDYRDCQTPGISHFIGLETLFL